MANSTSKMHKLLAKPFERDDFSFDQIYNDSPVGNIDELVVNPLIDTLNALRDCHKKETDKKIKKKIWYTILDLLPESYNQLRTWDLNYETLIRIHERRKAHKQYEWREFCKWIETLPYMKELLAVTEPDDEITDKKYSYKDIIMIPARAKAFIGRDVWCGATPMECINLANADASTVKLAEVHEEDTYPFEVNSIKDNRYAFIIVKK